MVKAKKTGIKVRQVVLNQKPKAVSSATKKSKKISKSKKVSSKKAKTKAKAKVKEKKMVKQISKKSIKKPQLNTLNTDDLVEELILNNKIHRLAEEKRRKIMWAGVSIVMFLIVVVWGYGLQKSFLNNKINSNGENVLSAKSWGEVSDKIGKQLNEIQIGIDKIDDYKVETVDAASSTVLGLPATEQAVTVEDSVASSSEDVVTDE